MSRDIRNNGTCLKTSGTAEKEICSIIPAYNESRTIGSIVRRLKEQQIDVYVVDDGSADNTSAIAGSEGAIVIKNARNMGKGMSMRKGFARAVEDGYKKVLVMDGDDQHDIYDICHLVECMRKTDADIVIGNRMCDTSCMPRLRQVINTFMSFVISTVVGAKIPDTQCGFRLIKSDALRKMELDSCKYEIESEMIIEASRLGLRIESVPVKTLYGDEKSRVNPVTDTVRFITFLVKRLLRRKI